MLADADKDKLIVYGWRNPLYIGNLKKAIKVVFQVGARDDVPVIHATGDTKVEEH